MEPIALRLQQIKGEHQLSVVPTQLIELSDAVHLFRA